MAIGSLEFKERETAPDAPPLGKKKLFLNGDGKFVSLDSDGGSTGFASELGLAAETSARTSADTLLGADIDSLELGLAAETSARTSADTLLGAGIDSLVSGLAAETSARTSADSSLQSALAGKQPSGSYAPATDIAPSAITGTAVVTADARLSDARTPLSHDHTASQITDFTTAVAAAAPAPSTSANSGLSITGTALATSYNTAIADAVVSTPVGGAAAAAASTWKSKNLVQVLDTILFPTIPARIGTPRSVTLTISGPSGDIEVGTSHSRTLTADFNRGTILNGDGTVNANPLVGPAVTHTFSGSGVLSQAGNTLTFPAITRSGSNTWGVATTYSAGAGQYFDNKGVAGANLAAERVASTITDGASAPTINGVYPYYYLKSTSPITAASMAAAIQGGTATKVIAASTGTLSIPYAPTAEYFAVAYPSTSTTKTRYFVTALDNGAITVVFSPVASQTVTTTLWSQDYRIHVSTAALTNSNSTIELRNT